MSSTTTAPAPAPSGPPPQRMSLEEFLVRYADVSNAELLDGFVKEQPPTFPRQGYFCARIGALIGGYVEAHDLGWVMSNNSWVRVGPESVLGGDILYVSYERLPRGEFPDGLLPQAPDLVVEVKSPSHLWGDLFLKVGLYLQAGVRAVVVLDDASRTAVVHRNEMVAQTFNNGDTLTLPDVLPGFSVPVARLFA